MKASDQLPLDFAGPEPEAEPDSLLPDPLDNSAKLNMQQAEELLLDSVKSDVLTFMAHWKQQHEFMKDSAPPSWFSTELTADRWYQEFYAWMGV